MKELAIMLSHYRFDSQYHPKSLNAHHPVFRLLEGGTFNHGQYCPVITHELDMMRIHYCRWGNEGIHQIYHKRTITPIHPDSSEYLPFPSQRSLVPANAFYFQTPDLRSWKAELSQSNTFCFAGICYQQEIKNGEHRKHFSILSTSSDGLFRDFNGLMPIVIPASLEQAWLNPNTSTSNLWKCLAQTNTLSFHITELQYLQEQDQHWSELAA